MVPFVLCLLTFWLASEPWRGTALAITLFWGCAILTFLSAVRRGLSFRTPGGETAAQIVTMLGLFCLGFAAIVSTALALPTVAAILLLISYRGLEVLDPIAARRLEAPLYFARLRPAQMASSDRPACSSQSCYWSGGKRSSRRRRHHMHITTVLGLAGLCRRGFRGGLERGALQAGRMVRDRCGNPVLDPAALGVSRRLDAALPHDRDLGIARVAGRWIGDDPVRFLRRPTRLQCRLVRACSSGCDGRIWLSWI